MGHCCCFFASTIFVHRVIETECGLSLHSIAHRITSTLHKFYPATRNGKLVIATRTYYLRSTSEQSFRLALAVNPVMNRFDILISNKKVLTLYWKINLCVTAKPGPLRTVMPLTFRVAWFKLVPPPNLGTFR